jgi:hypothetical protein
MVYTYQHRSGVASAHWKTNFFVRKHIQFVYTGNYMLQTPALKRRETRETGDSFLPRNVSGSYEDAFARLQRDTLFVTDTATKETGNSEWIVSYSSNGGTEISRSESHVNTPNRISDEQSARRIHDLDMGSDMDPFQLGRFLVSQFLSHPQNYVRVRCSAANVESMGEAISGILIASNIVRLATIISRSREVSDYTMLLVYISPSQSGPLHDLLMPEELRPDMRSLAREIFELIYEKDSSLRLVAKSEAQVFALINMICVISSEALASSTPPITMTIQPLSDGDCGTVSFVLIKTDRPIEYILEAPIELLPMVSPPGSSIQIDIDSENFGLVDTTNAVMRVFMAGYSSIYLMTSDKSPKIVSQQAFSELVLITVKYFELSIEPINGAGVRLTRKSTTVDPYDRAVETETVHDIGTESELIHSVITSIISLVGRGEQSTIVVLKSVGLMKELLCTLDDLGVFRYRLVSRGKRVKVTITPIRITGDVSAVLAKLVRPEPPGDVSPTNLKPVDASVRYGTDEEAKLYREKIGELVPQFGRLSVLLVGPRNIALGIRMLTENIAEGSAGFEFVSERAVRDQQGSNLKCAVRLFIKREDVVSVPPLNQLAERSAIINVCESDSRITIANQLFTALNEAENANPYVLVKAVGDHCVFIAVMSVVVANGWSRTIHQRVETRVAAPDADTLYYITRLIVNTE